MAHVRSQGPPLAGPNPRVPSFLRAVTWVECAVVFSAAALLFLAPGRGGRDLWAWVTPPFNARYIGAIYIAALVPLVIFAVGARWSPGRMIVWMILVFTAAIMVVMLGYPGRFEWGRPATWVFWSLYLFLPFNSAFHLWKLRELPVAGRAPTSAPGRLALTALALALGAYGVALLIVPEPATGFWPWPVDAFHGRIYAATFLAPAVGAWLVRRAAAASELRTLGLTLLALGVASAVGLWLTSPAVAPAARVDYTEPGTWAFLALNAIAALAGAALIAAGRRQRVPSEVL